MAQRIIIGLGLALILGLPMLVRPARERSIADAAQLIIITPHNEQIRFEFGEAFRRWHQAYYGEPATIIWSNPGGTSDIRRMLESQYAAALAAGTPPGGNADLVFGGGSYEHGLFKRGVRAAVNGAEAWVSISAPVDLPPSWLDDRYGENRIGDGQLYDPEHYWFGTALSGFGLVYNRDVLRALALPEPDAWDDLCSPKLRGWVALVNPAQSGSIKTTFETVLQQLGWERGWRVLRRAAANARYFSASSPKPPIDVSMGDAAMGICIDFYGRYQSQAIVEAGGGDRVGYVDPPGQTSIDADPVSMLRGAPHPEHARRFIEFCLSDEAQLLWQFPVRPPGAEGPGPLRYELRRMPIVRSMYDRSFDRFIDAVNPYAIARPVEHPDRHYRAFITELFAGMAMDVHDDLVRAWTAIVEHPSYPKTDAIVAADDRFVTDPALREMLRLFDEMPSLPGPDGAVLSLDRTENLAMLNRGWLRQEWEGTGLWHDESTPGDAMRRHFAGFFRGKYRAIVALAGGRATPQAALRP
jgi:ABC-type Fe3+ transport system substrate-binding protein